MSKLKCETCISKKEVGYELFCQHPYHPGRVAVNKRIRWDKAENKFEYVTGRESAQYCPDYKSLLTKIL